MPFKPLSSKHPGRPAIVGDRVSSAILPNGQVRLSISKTLADKFGLMPRCTLQIGCAAETGKILLSPADARGGTHACRSESKTLARVMVMAKRIGVSERKRSVTELPFEASGDGLIVDVRPLMKPVAVQNAA